jgi:O-antigen ligase
MTAILIAWASAFLLLTIMGGGIVVWSVCLAAAAAIAAWALIPARETHSPSRVHLAFLGALAGIVFLVALTLIPLPDPVIGVAGEPRAAQHREVVSALNTAWQVGLPKMDDPMFALTRNTAGTARMLALLLAAISMAALASRLDASGRRNLMAFLSLAGTAIAVLGYVAQHLIPQGDTLWWYLPIQHALPGPIACFGNRNHFAGFLALLSVAALAACVEGARRRQFRVVLLHGPAFCAMAIVLVLVLSRGALLSWVAGLAAVFVFGLSRRPLAIAALSLLIIVAAGGAVAAITELPVPQRYKLTPLLGTNALAALPELPVPQRYKSLANPFETSSARIRLAAWRDSVRIWASYPVIGAGANGYRTVFPQHRRTTEGSFATYPENLYVQVLAETGALGAGLMIVLVLAGACIAWRRWRDEETDRSSVIAGTGAGTVVLVHGMVDMPLQVPLYAITAGTLTGLLIAPAPPDKPSPRSLPRFRLLLATPAFLVAGLLALQGGRLRVFDAPTFLESADARDVQRALVWAPSSWHAWYYLGRHAFMLQKAEATSFGAHCMARAGACDPNNYRLWLEIGNMRRGLGDIEGARAAYKRVRELRDWVPIPALPEQPR